jgi:hypothetical protein
MRNRLQAKEGLGDDPAIARPAGWPWFTPFRPCQDRSIGRKKGFTGRTRISNHDHDPSKEVGPPEHCRFTTEK